MKLLKRGASLLPPLTAILLILALTGCGEDSVSNLIGKFVSDTTAVASDTSAAAPSDGAETDFADAVTPYAFSIAMTYYNGAWERESNIIETEFLWQAAAWNAAYNYRLNSSAGAVITESEAKTLQTVLNRNGLFAAIPDRWFVNDYALKTVANGENVYEFPAYAEMIDDFLGTSMEYTLETGADGEVAVTIIWHYDDGTADASVYAMNFVKKGEIYCLKSIALPEKIGGSDIGEASEAADGDSESKFDFTYTELYNENLLSSVFQWHSSVLGSYSDSDGYEYSFRLYEYNGSNAYLRQDETGRTGWYNGFMYICDDSTGRCDAIPSENGDYGDFLSNYFDYADMSFVSETDDEVVFQYYYEDYGTKTITVDRGTLLILQCEWDYCDDQDYHEIIRFSYDADVSDIRYLDGWQDELRTVIFVTETNKGHHSVLTETFYLPADWELFTYEAYYYLDTLYFAYLDEGYTKPYEYPGDGAGYTVYLTDSAG